MTEEIKDTVKREVDAILREHRLKKNKGHISYYNPMYMRDSWYGD